MKWTVKTVSLRKRKHLVSQNTAVSLANAWPSNQIRTNSNIEVKKRVARFWSWSGVRLLGVSPLALQLHIFVIARDPCKLKHTLDNIPYEAMRQENEPSKPSTCGVRRALL